MLLCCQVFDVQRYCKCRHGLRNEEGMVLGIRLAQGLTVHQRTSGAVWHAEGLITYHRTDGLDISQPRLDSIRSVVATKHPELLEPSARMHKSKAKNAQEAHEAIVVVDPKHGPRLPAERPRPQRELYELIWRRTLACQMKDATFDTVRLVLWFAFQL